MAAILDAVSLAPLPGGLYVGPVALCQNPGWFITGLYRRSHSGLKIRSPREFIEAQTATARVSGESEARSPVAMSYALLTPSVAFRT